MASIAQIRTNMVLEVSTWAIEYYLLAAGLETHVLLTRLPLMPYQCYEHFQ